MVALPVTGWKILAAGREGGEEEGRGEGGRGGRRRGRRKGSKVLTSLFLFTIRNS